MRPNRSQPPSKHQNPNTDYGKRYNFFMSEQDSSYLEDLVRVGIIQRWPNANRSTLIRALIAIVASGYDDYCRPVGPEAVTIDVLLSKAMDALPMLSLPQDAGRNALPAAASGAVDSAHVDMSIPSAST